MGHVVEVCWMDSDTSGGVSDTVVKELAARPAGWSSRRAVAVVFAGAADEEMVGARVVAAQRIADRLP